MAVLMSSMFSELLPDFPGDHNDQIQTYDCTTTKMDRNPHNGHCIIKYPNGDLYRGEYDHFKKNGYGKLMYKNGDFYDGNWVDDLYHGTGYHKNKVSTVNVKIDNTFS